MSSSDWDLVSWSALDRLRHGFLRSGAEQPDYWKSDSDLHSYDLTFAQRIGWKWQQILAELAERGWKPPIGEVLDWACGTGIAHRVFFSAFPSTVAGGLGLWDRSALAMKYAARAAARIFPGLSIRTSLLTSPTTLLLSHVLTELAESELLALLEICRSAQVVVWVEPGTYEASRQLISVREQLRDTFSIVAPCVHQQTCGMLEESNRSHWCHHFARTPPGVFTDPHWSKFATLTGIDLRALPLSYLVLDRRPPPALPTDAVRIIGRPRVYKAHALVLGCAACGVGECRLTKRRLPAEFRLARKDRMKSIQAWKQEAGELIEVRNVP